MHLSLSLSDSGDKTDKQVEMNDVYEELDHIFSKNNIKEFACRPVERGYAFDDVPDAPAEGTYMKVAYSFARK
jgi:hypothetical protein